MLRTCDILRCEFGDPIRCVLPFRRLLYFGLYRSQRMRASQASLRIPVLVRLTARAMRAGRLFGWSSKHLDRDRTQACEKKRWCKVCTSKRTRDLTGINWDRPKRGNIRRRLMISGSGWRSYTFPALTLLQRLGLHAALSTKVSCFALGLHEEKSALADSSTAWRRVCSYYYVLKLYHRLYHWG